VKPAPEDLLLPFHLLAQFATSSIQSGLLGSFRSL